MGLPVTIWMGFSVVGATLRDREAGAREALGMALARGGDQVIYKNDDGLRFYGGTTRPVQKRSSVAAKVRSCELVAHISRASSVLIMGHSGADQDCFGAAVGIARLAMFCFVKPYIVVDKTDANTQNFLAKFKNIPEYGDTFVTPDDAQELIASDTLLVIVDVNHASYTDEPGLVTMASSLVVLDHHRQSGESFPNPTLSYIESYASSACEMVAEILQYVGDEVKLKSYEADVMYSGIMIDTNNFLNKPGVRTFEAVAFLRRCGADISRIRKLLRCDINEYKIRAQAVQNTEIFMEHYAIAQCDANGCESPTIVGAKIANELLDVDKIKATFVLTEYEGKVYVSARSIDELNVQIVMERLGGGGHINSAGTQLENCTLAEGAEIIRQTLLQMQQDGDLI